MTRLLLLLIARASPRRDREWVVGDTVEELEHVRRVRGPAAAKRWLLREFWRVLAHAPRHRHAVGRAPHRTAIGTGDGLMKGIGRDVGYAVRVLLRAPGYTAMAILTLALGIGANTAIFSVVHAVLLKPLPFAAADRLMLVHLLLPEGDALAARSGGDRTVSWSYPKYRTLQQQQSVFDETALFAGRDFDLSGDAEPLRVRGEVVTDRYPAILGVEPSLGRGLTYEEAHRPGATVALIGHGLWTRRFGRDATVIGRSIQINAVPHTIVGVLPRGFRGLGGDAEVWVPLVALEPSQIAPHAQFSHSYNLVARRRVTVSEREAIAASEALGVRVDLAHRETSDAHVPWNATARSLSASRVDPDLRRASLVLLGAVGFVLLIACVNLTNLALAKAVTRSREVAVRIAIGAGRAGIARQFFVEGLVLASCGALAGLLLAGVLLGAAATLLPDADIFFRTSIAPDMPRIPGAAGLTRIAASTIDFDAATLLFTAGLAFLTAVLVSLAPALQASTLRPVEALKAVTGQPGATGARRGLGVQGLLVSGQVALALMLLAGAGLMVRSAARLHATSLGVTPDSVLTLRLGLPRATYTAESGTVFFSQLMERIAGLPGVDSVGLANCMPVSGGCNGTGLWFPPEPRRGPGADPLVSIHWASPEYFGTLGIRLLQGRGFADSDRAGQARVALVSETAARAFWPNESPLGRRVALGQGGFHEGAEVIGVVSDVRFRAIESPPEPDVFVPLWQSYQPRMRLFVRSIVEPQALAAAISREVHALDPNVPLSDIKTMEERIGDAMWRTRIGAWLLSAFAALALLLTAVGIFGVMAQTVAQRTSEIGIRMALGAQSGDVLRLIMRRAGLLTAIGLAAGTGGALALTRFVGSLLYEVTPHDPATFALVAVLIAVVSLLACYVPARRATRVDAVVALRSE